MNMKTLAWALIFLMSVALGRAETEQDRASLLDTTAAIRAAFARGDVDAIAALHDPAVVKYFGGSNVVLGRDGLVKGLREMFKSSKMEFIENKVESTLFLGDTAVETSIFTIRTTFKDGRPSMVGRGRAMVVYLRSSSSPTGWVSIREMAQAAPDDK